MSKKMLGKNMKNNSGKPLIKTQLYVLNWDLVKPICYYNKTLITAIDNLPYTLQTRRCWILNK
jgi:hypothetical protein